MQFPADLPCGFYNSGQQGQPLGYSCTVIGYVPRWLGWAPSKAIYRFKLPEVVTDRLFYVSESGVWYMTNANFDTDQGSVPVFAQRFIPKDRYIGFYLHDSGYMEKGLWVSYDKGVTWVFEEMSQRRLDTLLKEMVKHDPTPGAWWHPAAVYGSVRAFGKFSYGKGDLKREAT